ncbi:hypothetical protein EHI8A_082520 [Entamoeba histolytica HM-1:IMSS-B]|uniref:Uncharacterized protein n=6 Tax=Entamoeba histolytica TaxID=5759 RepID=C4M4H6_ENTH1|nr:hypothetical protein EHI_042220 [Entamoeba histolytica HM-1:IMSS]EMD42760.1 Hypothetical protein EHI5A_123360 [Entamoeba histolytica KU27]EMH72616.1 hypothetical protein EHI8A_082520 [Entamoeba histolytica HM-1:IMSS-B]EMS17476.1 hypothetical protein KM1_147540 [Entamoeba histolytica HM-3:IMSS]ENY64969.1 hypothetical protein EHI7A_080800 [Entamoeba histolytica HM-1:IMSS-A]BAN39913.1 hypothetical protein [Entamoeba histolytica]|eukprot:XP_656540.1 hypothetical protein EHI_042220 [Entamoeba histolytica HM-1:IMSS]
MTNIIPQRFSSHTQEEVLRNIQGLIQKVQSSLSINPETTDILYHHLEQIQGCTNIDQLLIFLYPLFFDLYRSPTLSSSMKQRMVSFFLNLLDSMNLAVNFNSMNDYNNGFIQSIQRMDHLRKIDINTMLDPLSFDFSHTLTEVPMREKRQKLKQLIANANCYQTQAIYTILLNKVNGWDFEINVDSFPDDIVEELLDMFDDLTFYC